MSWKQCITSHITTAIIITIITITIIQLTCSWPATCWPFPVSHIFRSPFNCLLSFLLPFGLSFCISLSNLSQRILFIWCSQFLLYSCTLFKTGVRFSSFTVCVFYACPRLLCSFLVHFTSAVVILVLSCALMGQLSPPYNKAGRASALYSFILVSFKVCCGLNLLFYNACYF